MAWQTFHLTRARSLNNARKLCSCRPLAGIGRMLHDFLQANLIGALELCELDGIDWITVLDGGAIRKLQRNG